MFYHPHFCCHCGEKIIRARWTLLTSRRFCEFCAIEQKQHDLIPRAAAIAIVLFGAAGFTAYIGGGGGNSSSDRTTTAKIRPLKTDSTPREVNVKPTDLTRANTTSATAIAANSDPSSTGSGTSNTKQRGAPRNSSTETVYYCGAMTKKGTACTRRVKSPGRCWQHLGQPAARSLQN